MKQTKWSSITFIRLANRNGEPKVSSSNIDDLPGDISDHAKRYGPQILKEIILLYSNFVLLLSISIVSTIGSWLIWPRVKFRTTGHNRNKLG